MKYLDSDGVLYFWQKIKTYITSAISNKVDKVTGKGLSTNDYTTAEKTKLTGIATGAEVNVQSDWNQATTTSDDYIKNKPTSMPASDVSSWAKAATKPTYTKSEIGLSNVDNVKQYSADNPPPYPVTSVNSKTGAVTLAATDVGALPSTTAIPEQRCYYGSCVTDSSKTSKLVSCHGFTLTQGSRIAVMFSKENTATTMTLQVNGTSAETVRLKGSMTLTGFTFPAGSIINFVYDGSYWEVENNYVAEAEDANALGGHKSTYYAPLASPALTGTPTAPTAAAGTNTTQIATTAFTASAIASALADITGISYQVVASLPATGQVGVIYLLSNSGTAPNIYDEYMWTGSAFEKIGTTDVDLSNYVQTTDLVSVTNAEIDTIVAS